MSSCAALLFRGCKVFQVSAVSVTESKTCVCRTFIRQPEFETKQNKTTRHVFNLCRRQYIDAAFYPHVANPRLNPEGSSWTGTGVRSPQDLSIPWSNPFFLSEQNDVCYPRTTTLNLKSSGRDLPIQGSLLQLRSSCFSFVRASSPFTTWLWDMCRSFRVCLCLDS